MFQTVLEPVVVRPEPDQDPSWATVWFTPEPGGVQPPEPLPGATAAERIRAWLAKAVVAPFRDLYERNGPVMGVVAVRDGDDIMLITTQGMVNRTHADEVRVTGRNTQGVRVMNLGEGDRLASLAKVAREDTESPAEPVVGEDSPPEVENS